MHIDKYRIVSMQQLQYTQTEATNQQARQSLCSGTNAKRLNGGDLLK